MPVLIYTDRRSKSKYKGGTLRELSPYSAYPPSKSQPSQNIYTPLPVSTSDY